MPVLTVSIDSTPTRTAFTSSVDHHGGQRQAVIVLQSQATAPSPLQATTSTTANVPARNQPTFLLVAEQLNNSIHIPPWEAENPMSRNQPLGAREIQDYRHHTICEWLLPAHRAFGDIGRDVGNFRDCLCYQSHTQSTLAHP